LVLVFFPVLCLYLADDRTLGSGDTLPATMTAVSVAREGNLDLNEYFPPGAPLPYFAQRQGDKVYSSYPAGMNVFAIPVALTAKAMGADLRSFPTFIRLEKLTAALLAAACAFFFFLLTVHLAPGLPAGIATLLLAVGSSQYSTVAQGLWQHGGVVFWGMLLFLLEIRQTATKSPWWVGCLQGLAAALMLATRLNAALFLLPLGIWMLLRSWRRASAFAVWSVVWYLPWLVLVHEPCYGTWTGPSLAQAGGSSWTWNIGEPVAGVLFSPGRGLVVYQPWLLIGLLGVLPAVRRTFVLPTAGHRLRGWGWVLGVTCLAQILLIACWKMWWGGYCWGSRLLADVMPWLALLSLPGISYLCRTWAGIRCLGAAALLAFALHFVAVRFHAEEWNGWANVDQQPAQLWNWERPPFLYVKWD
jgi:hypothetical protein